MVLIFLHPEPNTGWNNFHVLPALQRVDAFNFSGHFRLPSGEHSEMYINRDALYAHPQATDYIAWNLVNIHLSDVKDVDVVVGGSPEAITFAHYVARHIMKKKDIFDTRDFRVLYPEKQPDHSYELQQGYAQYIQGKNVLVVEDVVTTGNTMRSLARAVQKNGGNVVNCVCIVNRTGKENPINQGKLKVPFVGILKFEAPTYSPEKCPMCEQGTPVDAARGAKT